MLDLVYTECWVTLTSDVDCVVRCDALSTMGPALDADMDQWAKSYQQFWISASDRYLRVKGKGTGGTLKVYRSMR